ncbi:MAG: tRNA (adenosine(37)-N6)-threonylcarbamoyltransferase complex ATPase subunit type 1 TsaE [Campylobacterales bacterium]
MNTRWQIPTPEAFDPLCDALIAAHPKGAVVLLEGTLGAGKSTFAARFAAKLGYSESASPTFGVMHEYGPNLRHYDLYRIGSDGFFGRGLHETLEGGWALIEWPDARLERYLNEMDYTTVKLTITPEGRNRRVEVAA